LYGFRIGISYSSISAIHDSCINVAGRITDNFPGFCGTWHSRVSHCLWRHLLGSQTTQNENHIGRSKTKTNEKDGQARLYSLINDTPILILSIPLLFYLLTLQILRAFQIYPILDQVCLLLQCFLTFSIPVLISPFSKQILTLS